MTNEKFYEVLGDINENNVKEASVSRSNKEVIKMKNAYIPKLRGKKAVLIAAVIAVLLCGTAATA